MVIVLKLKAIRWTDLAALLKSSSYRPQADEISLRVPIAALLGCAAFGCSASVSVLTKPEGLTCTALNGAVVRLNLDLGHRTFQKEGFPSLPIADTIGRQIVLMRDVTADSMVSASIDRATMDYVASSNDRKLHAITETHYSCVAGPAFEVPNAR